MRRFVTYKELKRFLKLQLRHLRLEIFLTFSEGFKVFKSHFLIKIFLKKSVYTQNYTMISGSIEATECSPFYLATVLLLVIH